MVVVYSLKTDSWKHIQNAQCPRNIDFMSEWGRFGSGALYWPAYYMGEKNSDSQIVGFDLWLEQFREVTDTSWINNFESEESPLAFEGVLYILDDNSSRVDVFQMHDYRANNPWSNAFSLYRDALGEHEHNKHPTVKQGSCEFAKQEKEEPEIQTDDIDNDPGIIPVRMFPCKRYFSDDSSSTDSSAVSVSEESESEIQSEKVNFPEIEIKTDPGIFPVRMFPCERHFSDDSFLCDSDSDGETIAEEEEYEINKQNSPKDREKQLELPSNASDQTPTEPLEGRPDMESDPDPETQAIQLSKSSTTELMSGPTLPTSSILVKHGMKRPTKKLSLPKSSDDEKAQN